MGGNAAPTVRPVIDGIRREGITSLRGVAAALNERGMLTRRGGRWHVSNVRNLLKRTARRGSGLNAT